MGNVINAACLKCPQFGWRKRNQNPVNAVNSMSPDHQNIFVNRDGFANRDNAVNPINRNGSVNPVNRDSSVNPINRNGSVNPVNRDSSVNLINRNGSVNSVTQDSSLNSVDLVHSINRVGSINSVNSLKQQRIVNALLVVDVQYDFIDGTLALKNCPSGHQGEHVIPIINKLLADVNFDVVVYTQDWHTHDHISFFENIHIRSHLLADDCTPANELKLFDKAVFVLENGDTKKMERVEQILWPAHCIQESHGAELHEDLHIVESTPNRHVIHLLKGFDRDIDSYSAFWDNQKIRETILDRKLKEFKVTQVFIVGIATDVCVFATALHSVENGYRTFIIEDACRGVDETAIETRLDELTKQQCTVIQAAQVKHLINNPSVMNSPSVVKNKSSMINNL